MKAIFLVALLASATAQGQFSSDFSLDYQSGDFTIDVERSIPIELEYVCLDVPCPERTVHFLIRPIGDEFIGNHWHHNATIPAGQTAYTHTAHIMLRHQPNTRAEYPHLVQFSGAMTFTSTGAMLFDTVGEENLRLNFVRPFDGRIEFTPLEANKFSVHNPSNSTLSLTGNVLQPLKLGPNQSGRIEVTGPVGRIGSDRNAAAAYEIALPFSATEDQQRIPAPTIPVLVLGLALMVKLRHAKD